MQQRYNKRKHFRAKVSFPLSIELANQERTTAMAVNIGQGGMLLECPEYELFSKLDDVNLYLPLEHKQNSYTISAKITHIKDNEIGLFFYSDPTEYLEKTLA